MSEYCVPCGGCPCPYTSAKFVKSKCRRGDDIRSLLDSKFTFRKHKDDLGTLSCNFQARISIYGKVGDNSTFELLIPEQREYEKILECEPEYSDIFDFKFDFELQDTLDIFKNYSFLECIKEYEVVVDIFLLTSLESDDKVCDDFTQVDATDCPSSPTTTSDCVCNYESVAEDFSTRGQYEGDCDNICKIPRCFACGNYADVSGILYEEEVTETKSNYYVNLSLNTESYPFSSLLQLKLSSTSFDISKQLLISSAGGFESNLVSRILLEDVSNLPADISLDVEVEKYNEECECDCLYGFKDNDDSEKYDIDNSEQGLLNQYLIVNSQNYNNVNCSFGNCYMYPTSTSINEGDKYWFRYSVALTNDITNLWGHNCEYDMEVTLNIGASNSIYSETFPLNMVRSIKNDSSETSQTDLSGLKFIEIEKTVLLNDIDDNTNLKNSTLLVCFKNPKNSTEDGYTSSPKSNNICECCQEYDYKYFENYITSNPEECIPCKKGDSFYEESMDVTKKFNDAHYIAGLKGTFLMYANYELNGKQHRVLIGNGLGETKLHKIYSDTISEDYYKSNSDIQITHDLDED